jgi:hypothetical protein
MLPDATPRLSLFIASHKDYPVPTVSPYRTIGVGGHIPGGQEDALHDNHGDHIAGRNPRYSELTAWYWIWKNLKDVDIVGLCHYRRFFFFDSRHPQFGLEKLYMEPTPENIRGFGAQDPRAPIVAAVQRHGGIIVPRATTLEDTVSQHYRRCHRREDWQAFLQAIAETSSEHARQLAYFDTDKRLYPYNMMIAPWWFFSEYMALLMAVLGKVETLIDYPDDTYQQRIPAFLAERMFTLHLVTTRPKRYEVPVLITDRMAF